MALESRPPERLLEGRKTAWLVTIEEHCATPFAVPVTSTTWSQFLPKYLAGVKDRLGDVDKRLQIMDLNKIEAQIISLNQPGAQAFTDAAQGVEYCLKVNEFIYENYVQKHPKRFFAFAALPTQDGKAAAVELERCVMEYGVVGAMVNGYTATSKFEEGLYLDDPQFDALWEVAERLEKPIFIHPRTPLLSNIRTLADIPIMHGAPYWFGRETVEHVIRIMYTGVFDRFPKLKFVLGHMGEGLSCVLPRTDSTFRLYTAEARGPMKRTFLEYFQDNFIICTSGMPRTSALVNLMAEITVKHIMFSVDYPYESIAEMRNWYETVPVADETWKDMGYRNAVRLFNLPIKLE
ncbi:putative metal-dependent hydrolase [Hyaloscypha variabilis F]|uniref:Putative metal-dependent hydrolase n=1 Tax=Hyaloscypha variabilis (strain UAMH 11265 / GT02V1 / F) TaxID=1149755 RepID=A0A2J6QTQ0_HYAVF|nr:putative metal-dependent hydrolase [Hyaloscypha variabilis F]